MRAQTLRASTIYQPGLRLKRNLSLVMLPAMLHIQLLGDLHLATESGSSPRLATQKATSLLGFLVLNAGRAQPREVLAEMLWPQRPSENARRSLHTALWQIRRALKLLGLDPIDYLSASDLAIEWYAQESGPQAHYWLDVAEFDSAAAAADPESLRRAVELYRGDLLDGIYDDWCLEERYRLQDKFLQVLGRLTERALAEARFAEALDYAQRSLRMDNLREDAYRAAIVALYQLGQRTAALEQFAACVQVLKAELGVEPSVETLALYQSVLHESLPRCAPAQSPNHTPGNAAPFVLSSGGTSISPEHSPFAGRSKELEQLTRWWSERREPLALLLGEAGVGKTRLVQKWCTTIYPRVRICIGHCYAFERLLPYQALGEALRELLGGIPDVQLQALPAWILAELARLLPDLPERVPGCVPAGGEEQGKLFDAVARTLVHLSGNQPILFVIEDIHWAAESTLALLEYLVRRSHSSQSRQQVRWLATARSESLDGSDLHSTLLRLRRDDLALELPVLRLNEPEVVAWIGSWSGLGDATQAFGLQLYRETEGNAFFVTETIESLFATGELHSQGKQWNGSVLNGTVPSLPFPHSARELIEARIVNLPALTVEALSIAAVAGNEFDARVLQIAWGHGEDETLDALDDLLHAQLIREGDSVQGRDYVFTHDKIQETAYARLSHAKRAALHRRVALTLEREYGAVAAAELAYHYTRAGQVLRALEWEIQAGERAIQLLAYRDAQRYLTDAQQQLSQLTASSLPLALEIRLYAGLCQIYVMFREPKQLTPTAERFLQRAQQAHDMPHQVEALFRLGRGLNMANDSRAITVLAQARDLAKQIQDKHLPEILYRMGTCVGWLGNWTQALQLFAEAETTSQEFGDRRVQGWLLLGIGVAHMFTGNFGASIETYEQAIAEAEASGDQLYVASILGNLADNYLRLHVPQPSREVLRRAQAIWDSSGIVNITCLQNTGWMYHQLGELSLAREWAEKADHLARERNNMEQLRDLYPTHCALLLDLGERERALELAQEFCANPATHYGADDYLPLFTRGGVWLALDRLAEAEADLVPAIQCWERNPTDPQLWEAYIALGRLRHTQGDHEAAQAAYARARELILAIAHSLENLPLLRDEFLSAVLPLLELNG